MLHDIPAYYPVHYSIEHFKQYNLLIAFANVHVPRWSSMHLCAPVGKCNGWFPITHSEVGVCDVANWLFNVLIDGAMREAKGNLQGGVQLTTIPTCRCYFSWMI